MLLVIVMGLKFNFVKDQSSVGDYLNAQSSVVVVGILESDESSNIKDQIDTSLGNRGVSNADRELVHKNFMLANFKGQFGKSISVNVKSVSDKTNENKDLYIFFVGLGKENDFNAIIARRIGGKIYNIVSIFKDCVIDMFNSDARSLDVALGFKLASFKFNKYKTKKHDSKHNIGQVFFLLADEAEGHKFHSHYEHLAEGVFKTCEFGNEPPNVLFPAEYANRLKKFEDVGLRVDVLGKAELEELGMGALLGVAQGSIFEPKVVVMHWDGGKDGDSPVAFVGKGVTFDNGGVSLKPPKGMWDMKYDMSGSGVVAGTMYELASRKAKINAVGVVGLVENAIGQNAQRPSDIVTAMSGQTIEVLNTDAEGRLVLADILYYTRTKFKPKFMINFATLTGAIVVALGNSKAGLFSNDQELVDNIIDASVESGEGVWNMPLSEEYDKLINSKVADMQNISTKGYGADSISAAQFLKRFVGNDTPWAHVDIAGVSWDAPCGSSHKLIPSGATGFGVRLCDTLVSRFYELS